MKNSVPLRNLKVASPCPANWDEMYGDNRVRFCGSCRLNVYNLSDMTKTEAERLIASREGRLCVRYYRRADGTVLTKDCPVGLAAFRQRVSRLASAIVGLVLGLVGGSTATLTLRESAPGALPGRYEHTMGDIAMPPPREAVTGTFIYDASPPPPTQMTTELRARVARRPHAR